MLARIRHAAAPWALMALIGWPAPACSALAGREPSPPADSGSIVETVERREGLAEIESPGTQRGLFRVRYRGGDGRGRLRLTLITASPAHFQIAAADTFGRRLWSFESKDGASLLLDHRAGEFCRLEGDVVVRAVALSELSVTALPRVLWGELPVAPEQRPPQDGRFDYETSDGRRWSARFLEGRVIAWTLWREEVPLVWWKREGKGGILSHRDGAQALWSLVAEESSEDALAEMEVPDEYAQGRCENADLP